MHASNWTTTASETRFPAIAAALALTVALAVALAGLDTASAQVTSLFYQEVEKDGRVYVFNTPERLAAFRATGEMGASITLVLRGPDGETVVGENETALDLYFFKHGLPGYERPLPAPTPTPAPPKTLRVADGELRLSSLLQAWYVGDDSERSTTTSYLGNTTGVNTFRLRRAEIKLAGKVSPSWGFELMIDPAKSQKFTSSGVQTTDDKILQDFAITFLGLKGQELGIGQKKVAISEEGLRSSSELDFAERSSITRVIGDQRQTGLFYKGELGASFGAFASLTNGTPSNVPDDNDLLFTAARLDYKPAAGMVLGVSGGTGASGADHLTHDRLAAHFRWDGTKRFPLLLRFEYGAATDGKGDGKPDIDGAGWYASALYTVAGQYQVGIRLEQWDQNTDVDGDRLSILTAGFHYLVKGKNLNFKADWMGIEQEGRTVNGVLDERYNQLVLAAQLSF